MEKKGISVEIIGSETEKKHFGELVAAVDEDTRKKYVSAAVEAARSEVQQKFADAIEFKIDTAKKKVINAQTTPLYKLEDMFMREQEGRGNTAQTILFYKRVWRRLYDFLGFATTKTKADYTKLLNEEDMLVVVKSLPIIALQLDDFQAEFRWFLVQVCGNGEQTVQKNMRGVRAIMKYVAQNGWLDTPHIKVKDIEPPIKNTYTDKELEVLSRKPNPDNFAEYRNWMIVRYTMATGNRAGSIADIKVGDIDFEEGFININMVKNRQPIRLPLVRDILRELREYVAFYRTDENGEPLHDEPLFTTQFGEKLDAEGIGRLFRIYCKERGLTKYSIHLLRHTFAKRYITDGGDVLSLKAMLGHKSLKMVNHYARLYGTDIKDKVEQHSLINQTKVKSGRKKIVKRG